MGKSRGDRIDSPDEARKICVLVGKEQMALVEKLLAFLGESEEGDSESKILEQAVRAFTDEKVRYIATRYDIDVHSSTLTEMRQYRRETGVDIASRDTIVLPIPDTAENRSCVLEKCHWKVGALESEKLRGISYVGLYWRSPTWAVTHYAKILSVEPAVDGGTILAFDTPEPLREPLGPRDPENRLRRPRYTTLTLLMEARTLEELF